MEAEGGVKGMEFALGRNEKVWQWLESLGIDYGKEREVKITIGLKGEVCIGRKFVKQGGDPRTTYYYYEVVARGQGHGSDFWAWIDSLGFQHDHCQRIEIELDPEDVVHVRPVLVPEREAFERIMDVMTIEPVTIEAEPKEE